MSIQWEAEGYPLRVQKCNSTEVQKNTSYKTDKKLLKEVGKFVVGLQSLNLIFLIFCIFTLLNY